MIELGRQIVGGRSGVSDSTNPAGEKELVFFAPLSSAGWSFAVYLPEEQALADIRLEAIWLAGIMTLSLLLIAVAMWFVAIIGYSELLSGRVRKVLQKNDHGPESVVHEIRRIMHKN